MWVREWSTKVSDNQKQKDDKGSAEKATGKAEDAAKQASQKAEQGAKDAQQHVDAAAQDATQEAKNRAGDVRDQVKAQAQNARHRAQEEAQKGFEQGKGRVASQVSSVAQAFRKTGEQLRDEDQGDLAGYTERIADQVDKVSGYLEGKELRDMLQDAETFARQRPGLFVGGALVVGIFAARFLRSSGSHSGTTNR